jgi:hypothetical protein
LNSNHPCDILTHLGALDAPHKRRLGEPARIICDLFDYPHSTMEAERLNLIESTLADLARRADELRGYL